MIETVAPLLDEHELPSPIDPATRAQIDRALAQALADVPSLLPELEQHADALWLRLTGAERR